MIRCYRDLKVWQRGMDLVTEVYRLTSTFPRHELFGLTAQVRRATLSVPANIAEGHGRDHLGEYLHHLSIAHGSLMEAETHLIAAARLHYVKPSDIEPSLAMAGELGRMLNGLSRKLRQRRASRAMDPDT